ncbi:MAG: hypothetical protein ABSG70_07010 [Terriglobales bacterium]
MRRTLRFLTFSMLVFALGDGHNAYAQAPPAATSPLISQVEVFAGYSSIRANTVVSNTPLRLQGASFEAAFSVNNWLSLVGDFGYYRQSNIAARGFSLTLQSYQFGPRLTWHNRTRLTPFGELLLGGGNAGGTLYTRSLGTGMAPLGPNNGLLLTEGGGADWRVRPWIAVRLIQADFIQSYFLNGTGNDDRQNNLRFSTGVVVRFGNN